MSGMQLFQDFSIDIVKWMSVKVLIVDIVGDKVLSDSFGHWCRQLIFDFCTHNAVNYCWWFLVCTVGVSFFRSWRCESVRLNVYWARIRSLGRSLQTVICLLQKMLHARRGNWSLFAKCRLTGNISWLLSSSSIWPMAWNNWRALSAVSLTWVTTQRNDMYLLQVAHFQHSSTMLEFCGFPSTTAGCFLWKGRQSWGILCLHNLHQVHQLTWTAWHGMLSRLAMDFTLHVQVW